jgi:hypothetical protein
MSCFIKRARTIVFAFALYALLASPALGGTVTWQANGSRPPEMEWASVADEVNCGVYLLPAMLPDGRISYERTGFAASSSTGGAYHFHLNANDEGCVAGRSELALGNPERPGFPTFAEGEEVWVAMEVAISPDFAHGSLMQIHEQGGGSSPPLGLAMDGYQPVVHHKTVPGPGEGSAIENTPLSPLTPERWYDLVLRLKFATESPNGLVAIYVGEKGTEPKLVYEQTNTYLGTSGKLPSHLRVGNYVDGPGPEQDSWVSSAAIATSRESVEQAAFGCRQHQTAGSEDRRHQTAGREDRHHRADRADRRNRDHREHRRNGGGT